MTEARITMLVDNTAGHGDLLGEHGLAARIQVGSSKVLFDTGQGYCLSGNARRLGVRLELTDAVVLSHGHYDHTGGLGEALREAWRCRVYAHREAFGPKFIRDADGSGRDIGVPRLDADDVAEQAELCWVDGPTEVCPGIRITGPVPRVTDFEDTGGPFFLDRECAEADPLTDDQAAFIDTPDGTVVVLGCAHAGTINTLRYVRELTGGQPIHTVVGGMHLHAAGPERMERTVEELRRMDVRRLLPCHCAGQAAAARLWRDLPGRVEPCQVGTVIDLANPEPRRTGADRPKRIAAES